MNTYSYFDNSKSPSALILKIEAESLLEADKKFKEQTGKDPVKTPSIGVTIDHS